MNKIFALIATAALFSFACGAYAGTDDGVVSGNQWIQQTSQQAAAPAPQK